MRVTIVIPVFNDWDSLLILMQRIDAVAASLPFHHLRLCAVDDGSTKPMGDLAATARQMQNLEAIETVHLALNMGHQRAIAIGLCVAAQKNECDAVIVMDSDGEDPPEAIPELLTCAAKAEDFLIVARRGKRKEGLRFRISYVAYKFLFRTFVGRPISFGNFSFISCGYLRRLVLLPDLWNNLAAAMLRSRLPMHLVPVDRGRRYAGRSQMNFTSLVIHGFSAISAYAETIFVRLLMTSLVLTALTAVALVGTATLRLLMPQFATPGWATTVSFGMIIVLLQVLFVMLTSMLTLFNGRVQQLVVPIRDFAIYVERRVTWPLANAAHGVTT